MFEKWYEWIFLSFNVKKRWENYYLTVCHHDVHGKELAIKIYFPYQIASKLTCSQTITNSRLVGSLNSGPSITLWCQPFVLPCYQNNGENVVEYELVCKEQITRNKEYMSSLGLGNK